jgi:gluconolactonase
MPDRLSVLLISFMVAFAPPASNCGSLTENAGPGRIERLDSRADRLIPAGAHLEKLAQGFVWSEGPVWDRRQNHLLFSDVPANTVYRWSEGRGVSLFMKPSGYSGTEPFPGREPGSNGLAIDSTGRLVLCEHGDRRIVRIEKDGSRTVLSDRYRGRRLNSPNDLVFDSKGNLFFTDPPFGLPQTFNDPGKELDFSGVYRLTPAGELALLTADLRAPNGLALSPDEKTLYVSNSEPERPIWLAFPMAPDGSLHPGRLLYDGTLWAKQFPGLPDGLKVDRSGNLFAAGPGGIFVIAPDGSLLARMATGVATGNCVWGDDGRTLYITAGTTLYRIRLATSGW